MNDADEVKQSAPPETRLHKKTSLSTWLFIATLIIYLLTRLISLPNFPIYFFTDEAIQTMSAKDLITRGFRDEAGQLFPTYFENGSQYNLSTSVYLQLIPALIFENSIWVTRGVAVLASLLAALFIGLTLRDIFNLNLWWLGPLVLAVIPAWFLHSRTAFETTLMASFYSGFLYFYLRYRYKNPRNLYAALIFGALAFYAYSPGQVVVVFTGVTMLLSDLRYHRRQWRTILPSAVLLAILVLPYLRFRLTYSQEVAHHLQMLKSYWLEEITFIQKIANYLQRYLRGLNPAYWFLPNNVDLIRHQMKDMAHLPLISAPFFFIGVWQCIRNFKSPAHRLALFALLAAPSGAAIVDIAITRVLVLVIPAVMLVSLGFEFVLSWLGKLKIARNLPAILLFVLLSLMSAGMLVESLVYGPTWYKDYTLYGLQYGGHALFDKIERVQDEYPGKRIILSPNWANGTDVIARFFLGERVPIKISSVQEFSQKILPLDNDIIHILLPNEYEWLIESNKFTNIEVIDSLPYPDGNTGFYFVTFGYVPNIAEIIADEIAERQQPQIDEVLVNGIATTVTYPLLDINEIQHIFDGNAQTLIRTYEANPLTIDLVFDQAIDIQTLTALIGGENTLLRATFYFADTEQPITLSTELPSATVVRPATLELAQSQSVERLLIEIQNLNDGETGHVHLWEVYLQ